MRLRGHGRLESKELIGFEAELLQVGTAGLVDHRTWAAHEDEGVFRPRHVLLQHRLVDEARRVLPVLRWTVHRVPIKSKHRCWDDSSMKLAHKSQNRLRRRDISRS